MSNKLSIIQILSFIIIAGLLVLVVILLRNQTARPVPTTGDGITPAATTVKSTQTINAPAQNISMTLPDASKIVMVPGSQVEVLKQYGSSSNSAEYILNLIEGEIMVIPNLPSGTWFTVQTPRGYNARIQGCTMVVTYNPDQDSFGLDCISGSCELGPDLNHHLKAEAGKTLLYQGGILLNPKPIDQQSIKDTFGTSVPTCTLKPTPTSVLVPTSIYTVTVTPNAALTATAACQTFQELFPSTPCP